ncbi:unnamed protein product [Blepharisma stoltei]|uniref:Uncharacterized protein n=1 Tax=Blepharisma stoltei TaxID=1481888 RepID=A0AAU9J5F0_9CILI|nr:unnamed protein product [Blepharisma stoltei]
MNNLKAKSQVLIHQPGPDALFELNKMNLKTIFANHKPLDNRISLAAFRNFCKNSHVVPDLLSVFDLKRIFTKVTQNQSNKSSFSYQNFEQSLKYIAISGFHTSVPLSDKLQMLFLHIKSPCKKVYKVNLSTSLKSRPSTPFSHENSEPERDENRSSQRAYTQKLGLNKTSGRSHIKIPLDIDTILAFQRRSPLKANSTQRERVSPYRMIPCLSYKSISQDASPLYRASTRREKVACTAANSRRSSQDTSDKNKTKEICEATVKLVGKRHHRAMSAETYMVQSPKFGGNSCTPEESFSSLDATPKSFFQKTLKEKQIENLFKNFKEKNQNLVLKKTKKEPYLTSLRKHRNYIEKIRDKSFSKMMIARIIFNSWRGLKNKT